MTRADQRKFHYIYKITRTDGSGKYYIGMHSTDDLEDGYFGSGQLLWKSIKKHGKEKHVKEILEFLPSRKELKERERVLVNEEIVSDPLCLNLKLGGEGGGPAWNMLDEQSRTNQIFALQKRNSKPLTEEHKQNIGKGNRGKIRSEETKQRISDGSKKRDKSTYVGRPQKNSVWMNNNSERKFVPEFKVPEMEALGFTRGFALNRTDETLK